MIDIVIVNWNAGNQLFANIESISKNHNNLVERVIIVDNASTDQSIELVEKQKDFPFALHIIRNISNQGFASACNQGSLMCKSKYLLFLNPDTQLFGDSLKMPFVFMQKQENRKVGIIGIQLLDESKMVAKSCARFPTLIIFIATILGINQLPKLNYLNMHMVDWDHDKTINVDHVIGAFYFIRRSLFESLGRFDERFFVYLEDLDLSFRAHQSGFSCIYFTNAQAFHAKGGTSYQVKSHRLFYSLRSRLLYGFKHFVNWQAWILLIVTIIIEPINRILFSLLKGMLKDVRNIFNAYKMLYRDLPNIIKIRDKQ